MKTDGAYESLARGVSQQAEELRFPGQHAEQINMLSDPVVGLARRHGSERRGELHTAMSSGVMPMLRDDTRRWGKIKYSNGGKDYTVLYRTEARVSGAPISPFVVYNETDNVFLPSDWPPGDTTVDDYAAGGLSAITAVGRYVFFAGQEVVPEAAVVDDWDSSPNNARSVVWVRGGAYKRRYSAKVTAVGGTEYSFEYTTPSSAYDGLLDTSGVPVYAADPGGGTNADTESAYIVSVGGTPQAELSWHAWTPTGFSAKKGASTMTNVHPAAPTDATEYSWDTGDRYAVFHSSNLGAVDVTMTYTHVSTVPNPNYAKTVNDIVNAYNSAVTQWITTSSEAIRPENIAAELIAAATSAGVPGAITQDGGHIFFDTVTHVSVDDDGDGSLIRGVDNEVTSVDQVSARHWVGKVVKVRARGAQEAFYLVSEAVNDGDTGPSPVRWVEGAGQRQVITAGIGIATVHDGKFVYASGPASLASHTGIAVPDHVESTVGDGDSTPIPFFVGKKITFMDMFQDRLMIGAGGTIRASRIGDYLNFWRTTVLTIPADDTVEFLSEAGESDELRYSVLYDQYLVVFGRKMQYSLDAKVALTPTSANLPPMSAHKEAAEVQPIAAGGLIFYAKHGELSSAVYQISPGRTRESPESFPATPHLSTYLQGRIRQFEIMTEPTILVARGDTDRSTLYVFQYLDSPDQREQAAWYKWHFDESLGHIIGMSATAEGLLVFFQRVADDNSVWFVADLVRSTSSLSTKPYLDSLRRLADVESMTGMVTTASTGLTIAIGSSDEYKFLGMDLEDREDFKLIYPESIPNMWVGYPQAASFTPTNPYVRDKTGVGITAGDLTITDMTLSLKNSSGFVKTLTWVGGEEVIHHNARVLGDPNNIIGRELVTTTQETVGILLENNAYAVTFSAWKWNPFTVTKIEWTGMYFNRVRRIS